MPWVFAQVCQKYTEIIVIVRINNPEQTINSPPKTPWYKPNPFLEGFLSIINIAMLAGPSTTQQQLAQLCGTCFGVASPRNINTTVTEETWN